MPLGTDIWSGLSREWQFEPQLPEWEEGINCSSLLRILPPTIQQSKAYVRHVDNITNFWRIQFLSRHSSVGVQRDQKWTLRAVLSEFDEGHSTMRILSRCVYIVEKKVKMEGYFRMINSILISQCGLLMEKIIVGIWEKSMKYESVSKW